MRDPEEYYFDQCEKLRARIAILKQQKALAIEALKHITKYPPIAYTVSCKCWECHDYRQLIETLKQLEAGNE
jgi:hypothetical protein